MQQEEAALLATLVAQNALVISQVPVLAAWDLHLLILLVELIA